MRWLWAFLGTLVGLVTLAGCGQGKTISEQQVRDLNHAYISGWKEDGTTAQQNAVMPLFMDNAVVIPSGGRFLLDGHEMIEGFWFPADSPPTVITLFEHEIADITVNAETASFHGLSKLGFEYAGTSAYQEAYFFGVAALDETNTLKFTYFAWIDHPKE